MSTNKLLVCFATCILSATSFRRSIHSKTGSTTHLDTVASPTQVLSYIPTPARDHVFQCPPGATEVEGCLSICKRLEFASEDAPNGECPGFRELLVEHGYTVRGSWRIWRRWRQSTMDGVMDILNANAGTYQSDFLVASLITNMRRLSEVKKTKYAKPLGALQAAIDAYEARTESFDAAAFQPPAEDDGGSDPLPPCSGPMQAGDIITFEVGGPDFADISAALSDVGANEEALQLQLHFDYGDHVFEHKWHYEYESRAQQEEFSAKVAVFFKNLGKGIADVSINMGKGLGNAVIFIGKGASDVVINTGKQIGRFFVFCGAGITATYASVRQTTSHTGSTKFTHSEIALSPTSSSQGPGGEVDICNEWKLKSMPGYAETKYIVSRFQGDGGAVGNQTAESMQKLAAQRANLWIPYLQHYADSPGQWHRVIFGKCLRVIGNAGHSDYWQAVTQEKVEEMWDYEPSDEENEKGFWAALKDSVKGTTHDAEGTRIKPKAMFCSKFTSAVWSSVIGNPTDIPDAPVRHGDVNKMFPLNPGACSPWTMGQYLLGTKGRKYWNSCIVDMSPAGKDHYQPCASR